MPKIFIGLTRTEGSKPNFTDVKAGAWYTGWINAAESLNLVQGYDGKFRPNDTVSNQEVITVLARMLGYNDNLPGSWPTNYVTQANKIDLLDDVSIVAAAAANRADVAVMMSNTLDANLVTYDKDTDEFVKKQTTKGGTQDTDITLLDDAFDGKYIEVTGFAAVSDIRDAAAGTLNWGGKSDTGSYGDGTAQGNYIIDADTRVSVNGGSLFDLEGHEGKIYYTIDNGKAYAKFIEVDSYKVAVSDQPKLEDGKVVVNKTKYSIADGFTADDISANAQAGNKNSKYVLYMNDDDQVYAVFSDLDDQDKAYFVKSVSSSTAKLVGGVTAGTTTIDADDDSLVWTENGFITTEELEVGDAIVEVGTDLYVMTEAKTGVLKSMNGEGKINIDGTNYVTNVEEGNKLDSEYETSDAVIEDVYGNTVTYLLNDNNSIAAIIVDEITAGSKLYGVVVDGDDSTGSWKQGSLSTISVFTEEGTVVEYDFDDDYTGEEEPTELMGRLVEYKLNKDGEIKSLSVVGSTGSVGSALVDTSFANGVTPSPSNTTIDVKNNAYLVETDSNTSLTLASNVAIFEIEADDKEVDVTLVTRAALLAEDDIKPGMTGLITMGTDEYDIQYFSYVKNTNGAVRALAYTNAGSGTDYYGVINDFNYANSDVDHGVTLVGDETEYEFDDTTTFSEDGKEASTETTDVVATDDDLIIYEKSGSDITVKVAYADKKPLAGAKEVNGFVDGLITLGVKNDVQDTITPAYKDGGVNSTSYDTIMTDANTVVYVMNSQTGKFEEGTLADIYKGAWVYVPAVDDDDYADIVIVDEYNKYEA